MLPVSGFCGDPSDAFASKPAPTLWNAFTLWERACSRRGQLRHRLFNCCPPNTSTTNYPPRMQLHQLQTQ
ncbi:hypothetical protein C3E97_014785 [Pseudomonas sp. MWU12-2115]|nr:hypothetical protein C3E97_014785 [Pseudomonas sp. MWU12-2115]